MRAAALILAATLGGCALLQPEAEQSLAVSEIVATAVTATQGGAAAQRRALSTAQQAFERDAGDTSRLRLATLLAALPAPHGDEVRAAALLAPLVEHQPLTPYGQFATLLTGQLSARTRIVRESERSARANEQREDALRQQQDALRQQLEHLKTIERSILEREEQMRRKQR